MRSGVARAAALRYWRQKQVRSPSCASMAARLEQTTTNRVCMDVRAAAAAAGDAAGSWDSAVRLHEIASLLATLLHLWAWRTVWTRRQARVCKRGDKPLALAPDMAVASLAAG